MEVHHATATIDESGSITLRDLPFSKGQDVEIVVTLVSAPKPSPGMPFSGSNPLKGSVLKYVDPFEPACPPEDWEVLR